MKKQTREIKMNKLKKLSKVKHNQFVTKLTEWIEINGGVKKSTCSSDYIIDTIYGEMTISLTPVSIDSYGYEVYCRFLGDLKAASVTCYINPYSGKWNHSIYDVSVSVEDAIEYMIKTIEPVLIKVD